MMLARDLDGIDSAFLPAFPPSRLGLKCWGSCQWHRCHPSGHAQMEEGTVPNRLGPQPGVRESPPASGQKVAPECHQLRKKRDQTMPFDPSFAYGRA
jgi:hypothetical protein